jgi:hypothetical protein
MSISTYDNVIDFYDGGVGVSTSANYILLLQKLSTSDSQSTEEILAQEYGPNYCYHCFNGEYYAFSLNGNVFTIYTTEDEWTSFITQKRTEVANSTTMTDREVILALGIEGGVL